MAGYMCDSEDGQPADFLFTNLNNGDVTAWCTSCVVTFAQTLIESLQAQESPDGIPAAEPEPDRLDVSEEEAERTYHPAPETANLAGKEGEATPSTPGRKSRRTRDPTAKATPEIDQAPDAPDRID